MNTKTIQRKCKQMEFSVSNSRPKHIIQMSAEALRINGTSSEKWEMLWPVMWWQSAKPNTIHQTHFIVTVVAIGF